MESFKDMPSWMQSSTSFQNPNNAGKDGNPTKDSPEGEFVTALRGHFKDAIREVNGTREGLLKVRGSLTGGLKDKKDPSKGRTPPTKHSHLIKAPDKDQKDVKSIIKKALEAARFKVPAEGSILERVLLNGLFQMLDSATRFETTKYSPAAARGNSKKEGSTVRKRKRKRKEDVEAFSAAKLPKKQKAGQLEEGFKAQQQAKLDDALRRLAVFETAAAAAAAAPPPPEAAEAPKAASEAATKAKAASEAAKAKQQAATSDAAAASKAAAEAEVATKAKAASEAAKAKQLAASKVEAATKAKAASEAAKAKQAASDAAAASKAEAAAEAAAAEAAAAEAEAAPSTADEKKAKKAAAVVKLVKDGYDKNGVSANFQLAVNRVGMPYPNRTDLTIDKNAWEKKKGCKPTVPYFRCKVGGVKITKLLNIAVDSYGYIYTEVRKEYKLKSGADTANGILVSSGGL